MAIPWVVAVPWVAAMPLVVAVPWAATAPWVVKCRATCVVRVASSDRREVCSSAGVAKLPDDVINKIAAGYTRGYYLFESISGGTTLPFILRTYSAFRRTLGGAGGGGSFGRVSGGPSWGGAADSQQRGSPMTSLDAGALTGRIRRSSGPWVGALDIGFLAKVGVGGTSRRPDP